MLPRWRFGLRLSSRWRVPVAHARIGPPLPNPHRRARRGVRHQHAALGRLMWKDGKPGQSTSLAARVGRNAQSQAAQAGLALAALLEPCRQTRITTRVARPTVGQAQRRPAGNVDFSTTATPRGRLAPTLVAACGNWGGRAPAQSFCAQVPIATGCKDPVPTHDWGAPTLRRFDRFWVRARQSLAKGSPGSACWPAQRRRAMMRVRCRVCLLLMLRTGRHPSPQDVCSSRQEIPDVSA